MDPTSVRATLAEQGFVVLQGAAGPEVDPWRFVESLVGERPSMLERQPIRPVAGGRSFASSKIVTPLHTDSQDFRGAPPALQVMICRQPAAQGGAPHLVDGWALLSLVEAEDPVLFRALFEQTRRIPFYFGAVPGPTVARKAGALVLTVSPMADQDDVGLALARFVARAPHFELVVARDDVLLVDNHRVLHGRGAFDDDGREFLRLLAWLPTPLSRHERYFALARETISSFDGERQRRSRVVYEMLTGVPPAKLAAREGIPEAELYRWRSELFD